MKIERSFQIESVLGAYNPQTLQGFVTLQKHLKNHKISIKEATEYIKKNLSRTDDLKRMYKIQAQYREIEWLKIAPKCPKCNNVLRLFKINEPKGKANKFGYKCRWVCYECGFEKLKKASMGKELRRIGYGKWTK